MGKGYTLTVDYEQVDCSCGISFLCPHSMLVKARKDSDRSVYCPGGCEITFGNTKVQELERSSKVLRDDLAKKIKELREARATIKRLTEKEVIEDPPKPKTKVKKAEPSEEVIPTTRDLVLDCLENNDGKAPLSAVAIADLLGLNKKTVASTLTVLYQSKMVTRSGIPHVYSLV